MQNTQNRIWNTTLYLRLSRDDGDKEESNSITGHLMIAARHKRYLRCVILQAVYHGTLPAVSGKQYGPFSENMGTKTEHRNDARPQRKAVLKGFGDVSPASD